MLCEQKGNCYRAISWYCTCSRYLRFVSKATIEFLFCKYALSLSRLHGQGYDGASNMQGEFNGLKTLILKENKLAFYVHCFAHQLQLTLVAIANKHTDIAEFFSLVSKIVTIVGAS